MRKELKFNSNNENLNKYMTRATDLLRSIRTGSNAVDGINYQNALSTAEQAEFTDYVSILAISEMEKGAGKSHLKSNQFGSDAEDFISNYKIVILKNLDKYNDSDHLTEDGKKYCFSTFLKHLAPEALSMTYADIHGVTRDVEKKFTLVMGIMKRIAAEKQIAVSAVTPEMIHEIKKTTSVRDITAILDYVRGKASVEQMMEEDSWEKEGVNGASNLDTNIFDVLDLDTEKLFDAFFAHLTDIEKFFVLLEVHCCDEKYTRMTSGELATDDILVSIVAADSKLKKNISTGDIKIERPGRSSASGMTSIEMKNVEFVSDNVIRYQRRKAVSTLKSLRDGLQVSDIIGTCGVNYFRNQWNMLVQKYL
ncbi:MAG: hypothetical protein ACOX1S_15390 [Anaerostipes sp.]|jgi:phage gp36-like protein